MDATQLAAAGIVTLAGLMRGITGLGGAILMAPVVSRRTRPVPTVITALTLEAAAG